MAEQENDQFDDEFIIVDDEGPSNRPFILAASGLIGLLVLSLICLFAFRAFGGGGDGSEEIASATTEVADNGIALTATSISATNEAIATQNGFVTQTVESMRMTEEAPTSTPTPTATNTATPLPTNTPTSTPVVAEEGAEGEGAEGEAEGEDDPNAAATSIFSDQNTVTPESGGLAGDSNDNNSTANAGGVSSDAAAPATGGGTSDAELPETGISLWAIIAAAIGLFFLFVVSRRLRTE